MTCKEYDALLEKWVLGEATAEELAAMDAHEASCPSCAALRGEMAFSGEMLHVLEGDVPPVPADFHASWTAQIKEESGMEQEKKQASRRRFHAGRWIAIAATLVFVFIGAYHTREGNWSLGRSSDGNGSTSVYAPGATTYSAETDGDYNTADYADAGIMTASAPMEMSDTAARSAGTQYSAGPVPETKKIIRTVTISLFTTAFDESVAAIKGLGQSFGGWIESLSEYNQGRSTRRAYITLRIPAEKLDEFLGQASAHGRVSSREETAEDITARYQDNQGRLTTQRALMDRLRSLVAGAASLSEVLELERTIADTQYAIDALEASLRHDDSQVDYATVSLTVTEEKVPDQMEVKEYTFFQRMEGALITGLEGFLGFLMETVLFILAGLPYLAVALVCWLVLLAVRRSYRKRHPRKAVHDADPAPAEKPEA